jgi:hypothetical protein
LGNSAIDVTLAGQQQSSPQQFFFLFLESLHFFLQHSFEHFTSFLELLFPQAHAVLVVMVVKTNNKKRPSDMENLYLIYRITSKLNICCNYSENRCKKASIISLDKVTSFLKL